MRKKYFIFLAINALFFISDTSFACSVCKGGATQEKLNAYNLTTGILAGLPIVMGLLFFLLFRRAYRATNLKP
ncbi:MAG: hypothetical protein AABZ32_08670 [Bacteroidota bacterium]